MNHKQIDAPAGIEQQNGQYEVKRSCKLDVIAAVVCLLVALLVWLVFMNRTETDYVELVIANPQRGCEYELSVTQIEVEGSVIKLRSVSEIGILLDEAALAELDAKSVCHLDESDLQMPDGVSFSKSLSLTVTVKGGQ